MAVLTKVAKASEVPKGTGKVIEVGGRTLALFNCEGAFYAMENACQHHGGPLGEGDLSDKTVTCPWHGWTYDVASGACQTTPGLTLQTFNVTVDGDDLLVAV